jgi:hypothetical protein
MELLLLKADCGDVILEVEDGGMAGAVFGPEEVPLGTGFGGTMVDIDG